jgi:hypothetical protein
MARVTCSSSVEGSERGKQTHCMRQVVTEGLREGGRSFSYKGFTLLTTMCAVGRCCIADSVEFQFFPERYFELDCIKKSGGGGRRRE